MQARKWLADGCTGIKASVLDMPKKGKNELKNVPVVKWVRKCISWRFTRTTFWSGSDVRGWCVTENSVDHKGTILDDACRAKGIIDSTPGSAQQRFLFDLVIHHGTHQCSLWRQKMLRHEPFYDGILWYSDILECAVAMASTYNGVSCTFGLRCIRSCTIEWSGFGGSVGVGISAECGVRARWWFMWRIKSSELWITFQ